MPIGTVTALILGASFIGATAISARQQRRQQRSSEMRAVRAASLSAKKIDEADKEAAATARKQSSARRKRRAKTVLTSPQGVLEDPKGDKKNIARGIVQIRTSKAIDFGSIVELVEEFHQEYLTTWGLKYHKGTILKWLKENSEDVLVLEIEGKVEGILAGKETQEGLYKEKVFQEVLWYVRKKYRSHSVKLLKTLEKICVQKGRSSIIMSHLKTIQSDKLSRLYQMLGYQPVEIHYIKAIT